MKLDEEYQTAMDEANDGFDGDGEFEPFPDGYYLARVESIKMSDRAGESGYKQWVVVWRILQPRKFAKRTQWYRISLSPKAAFKMREFFEALGFAFDSDSKELIGETAILELFQEEIGSGKRAGEMGNSVEKVHPADDPDIKVLVAK